MPADGTVIGYTYRIRIVTDGAAPGETLVTSLWINGAWDATMHTYTTGSGATYYNYNVTGLTRSFSAGDQLGVRVVETGTIVWGPLWAALWVTMRHIS
jgi:hypothetical protein